MNSNKELSLEKLLNFCSNPKSLHYESAWTEFVTRYQKYIYTVISKKCHSIDTQIFKIDFQETLNEIFDEVIIKLCTNNHTALKNFHHKDNERIFLAWLAKISNNAAYQFIKNDSLDREMNLDFYTKLESPIGNEVLLRLYEDLVSILRSYKNTNNTERDINIYILFVWYDYTLETLRSVPCLRNIGYRVPELTLSRMRKYLRKNRELL